MFVKTVRSNIKGGVDVTLGQFTLLYGPNGSGKSSIVQAIQLAADGFVRDGEGREELKTYGPISRFFPSTVNKMFATAVLSDDTTEFHWELHRKGEKLVIQDHKRPGDIVFPLQEVQEILRREDKGVRTWLSRQMLGDLTVDVMTATLTEEEKPAVRNVIREGNLALDWNEVAAECKKKATSFRREATIKESTVDQTAAGLASPIPDHEVKRMKQRQQEIYTALAASQGSTVEDVAALRADVKKLLDVQDQDTATLATLQTSATSKQDRVAVERAQASLALIKAQVKDLGVECCGVCGTKISLDKLKENIAAANTIVAANQKYADMIAVQKRLNERLVTIHEKAAKLKTIKPVDVSALKKELDTIVTRLAAVSTSARGWEIVNSVRAEVRVKRNTADILDDASKTLAKLGKQKLKDGLDVFCADVSKLLPSGFQLGASVEAARLGFIRDGELHTALSGGESSLMLIALGGYIGQQKGAHSGTMVLIPDDRAWDSTTLGTLMAHMSKTYDGQVILMSTVLPVNAQGQFDFPEWTVIDVAAKTVIS